MILIDDEFENEEENVFTIEEQNEIKRKIAIHEAKVDRYYAKLTETVLKYILKIKNNDKTIPIVDIITNFCFINELEPELVGDAISQNFYFKELIEKDLKQFSTKTELEEW